MVDAATAVLSPNETGGQVMPQGNGAGYHACWYPVAFSSDVPEGAVVSRPFLDGRVTVFRGASGKAAVVSPFCRHLGADLAVGEVIGDQLRCAFHHWCYSRNGQCARIPAGEAIPEDANLFAFPTSEAWGFIWAFNGPEPLYDTPTFVGYDEAGLAFRPALLGEFPVECWVFKTNSMDFQHLRIVHGLTIHANASDFAVQGQHITYEIELEDRKAGRMQLTATMFGTNALYLRYRLADGTESMSLSAGSPVPGGAHRGFVVFAAAATGDANADSAHLDKIEEFYTRLVEEDRPVVESIRFRRDRLLEADSALSVFLDFVADYPRNDDARPFIT